MADTQFLRLNDGWALAHDSRQWLIQRRETSNSSAKSSGWKAVSFIAHKKPALLRVLREKGVKPTPEAQTALDTLPDTFCEFYAAVTERPKVAPGELFKGVVRPLKALRQAHDEAA